MASLSRTSRLGIRKVLLIAVLVLPAVAIPGFGQPSTGTPPRTVTRSATVQAFETVELFSQVTGLLKARHVDIGDLVKKGQVLAEIDAPQIIKELQRLQAGLKGAHGNVQKAEANSIVVRAE